MKTQLQATNKTQFLSLISIINILSITFLSLNWGSAKFFYKDE